MIYQMFQAQTDLLVPVRLLAGMTSAWLDQAWPGVPHLEPMRRMSAVCELIARTGTTHKRPPFGIATSAHGNRVVAVQEQVIDSTPFGSLLHFAKEGVEGQPKILVAAPMSGHFATLLRGTVEVLLPDNDVYITDWHNARDVPVDAGTFDLDDYIEHLMRFIEVLGPGSHVLAVCQPTVPVLAAVALMAQAGSRCQPRSMTLMAGPIDTRIHPTSVNVAANEKSIEWFAENLIGTVPLRHGGGGRKVYPGFMQLAAFTSMNSGRHLRAHLDYLENMVEGRADKVAVHRKFYDEYMAVMDLPAEFFLQTVKKIF